MVLKRKAGTTRTQAWQVKGVSPETREAVGRVARKSGKTIGQWVDETLHREAVAELTGKADKLPMETLEAQFATLNAKLDDMRQPFWGRLFGKR